MERSQFVVPIRDAGYIPASRPGAVAAAPGGDDDPVWPTLLDAAGGASGVRDIVDRLDRRLLDDPLLAASLEGVDLVVLKSAQVRFFTAAFCAVRADEPSSTVAVRVSGEQFTRVVLHVHDVLVSLGLPETVTEQLMLAVLGRGLARGDAARLTMP